MLGSLVYTKEGAKENLQGSGGNFLEFIVRGTEYVMNIPRKYSTWGF
jgi:hypothetical protein